MYAKRRLACSDQNRPGQQPAGIRGIWANHRRPGLSLSTQASLAGLTTLGDDLTMNLMTHSVSQDRGPDFVGIGVQKSGTTWLAHILAQHPDILMRKKEIRFFVRFFHRGYDWYEEFFKDKRGRVAGELSVHYICSPRPDFTHREFYPKWNPRRKLYFWRRYPSARNELAIRYPSVKVFAIFRNPVDRAWSHYWYWRRRRERNRKRVVSFEQMFADDGRWIRTQGCYADLIAIWREKFPHMGTFFYDDILVRPQELAREIYRYVGVNDCFVPELSRVINRGSHGGMPDSLRAYLTDAYQDQIQRLEKMTGRDLSAWLTSDP